MQTADKVMGLVIPRVLKKIFKGWRRTSASKSGIEYVIYTMAADVMFWSWPNNRRIGSMFKHGKEIGMAAKNRGANGHLIGLAKNVPRFSPIRLATYGFRTHW